MVTDTNIAFILLGIAILFLLGSLFRLEWRLNRLLSNNGVSNLEESIAYLKREAGKQSEFREEMEKYLRTVEERLRGSVRGVSTIRFNPFKGDGSGGNQSFATAFLNDRGDGVVFSSLYSRERVSVFAKPIKRFNSEHELSKEERDVIGKARAEMVSKDS